MNSKNSSAGLIGGNERNVEFRSIVAFSSFSKWQLPLKQNAPLVKFNSFEQRESSSEEEQSKNMGKMRIKLMDGLDEQIVLN